MTRAYTATYASPIKGVSQQNPRNRLDGQCEAQVNLIADPIRSLTVRPPINFMATLRNSDKDIKDYLFSYKDNEYILSAKQGFASLYSLTEAKQYTLKGSVPAYVTNNYKVSANADTILFLNKDKVTAMSNEISSAQKQEFLVYVKGGVTNTTYGIRVMTQGQSFTKTYEVKEVKFATADNVAKELYNAFNSDGTFKNYFTIALAYDTLYFSLKDKRQAYSVSATDGYGGQFLVTAVNSVKTSADLPKYAPNGFVLAINPLPESRMSNYYMKYVIKSGGFGTIGAWVETAAVGIKNKFDLSTMPHEIVIDFNAKTFEIKEAGWYPRRTGDEKSNPTPSFIGKTINDMDIVQGRVGMVSQSFFLTRSKEPLDCYRNSATVLVDSDPIDIENTVEVGKKIDAIIQYGRSVSLYAQDVQFLTDASQALNPVNTAMPISSNFAYDGVTPVTTGVSVIHSYKKGEYTALLEIYPKTDNMETPFSNVTEQVERYIKGNCKKMVSNLAFNTIYVMSDANPRVLYRYKYLFSGNEKVLSAWCELRFPFNIDNVFSFQDKLYLVYSASGKTYLGQMPLDYPLEEGLNFTILLDNKTTIEIKNGEGTLPFTPTLEDYSCIMVTLNYRDKKYYSGLPYEIEAIEGNKIILKDKEVSGIAVVGIPIAWEYIPSRPYLRDQNGDIDDTGVLNVIKYEASLQNTASFKVAIVDLLGNEQVYEVSANKANFSLAEYDKINLINDTIVLPFNRESARYSLKLFGKSYAPFTLVDLAYTFKFYRR